MRAKASWGKTLIFSVVYNLLAIGLAVIGKDETARRSGVDVRAQGGLDAA